MSNMNDSADPENIKVRLLIKRIEYLFTCPERLMNETMWAKLNRWLLNNQSNNNHNYSTPSYVGGRATTQEVFASQPMAMVQQLSAALQSLLTNPATVWSKLREEREDMNSNVDLSEWLENANHQIHLALNDSNFYAEMGKFYSSIAALGNGVLLQEEIDTDDDYDDTKSSNLFKGFKFTALHMSQCAWAEDKNGFVNTLAWKFEKTALQAMELWGDKCSDVIKASAIDAPDRMFRFVMYIGPRSKDKVKLNDLGVAPPENRPYECLYIDLTTKQVIEETGYYEFPAHSLRWSLQPGEHYGRGQGHIALPDVISYNKLCEEELYAVAKDNRPPILANQRDVFGQLNLSPGSINIVRNKDGLVEFVSKARDDRTQKLAERLLTSIKSTFFLDQLLLPPREDIGQMREAEVMQRIKQINTVFGPIALRITSEFLDPLITRSFKILLRTNVLGPLPPAIRSKGLNLDIVYINELETAQNIAQIQNLQQFLMQVAGMAQLNPQVLDIPNYDQITKDESKAFGILGKYINDDEVVKNIRDERQKQQQEQMQAQQANLQADTNAKNAKGSGPQQGQMQLPQPSPGGMNGPGI